jgi:hypothetical protein
MSTDERRQLYDQLQMVLAGHPNTLATQATLDLLATALTYDAETLEDALASCNEVADDLRSAIARNWDNLREARRRSAAAVRARYRQ